MEFSDANFDQEVLQSDVPVLVDFWAPWCGPCQQMKPLVEELEAEHNGKGSVKIGKINVDENPNTAGKHGVMSIPAFKVFKGGQVVAEAVGGMTKEDLVKLIERGTAA